MRQADARIAALHLRGLLEAEWLERFLFHIPEPITAEAIKATVERAIAAFMAAYGPLQGANPIARKQT